MRNTVGNLVAHASYTNSLMKSGRNSLKVGLSPK